MASFAKIGLNGKVIEVQSVHNEVLHDSNGVEQENIGIDFLTKLTGWSIWKQTSYNNNFRGRYCNIGDKYDPVNDVFIPFKPFPNWVWSDSKNNWVAPVADPSVNANEYGANWDQENNRWSGVNNDGVGVYWDPDTSSWKNQ